VVTAQMVDEFRAGLVAGDLALLTEFDQELVQLTTSEVFAAIFRDKGEAASMLLDLMAPVLRAEAEKRAPAEMQRQLLAAADEVACERWERKRGLY
jgi:hypothetical protein